MQVRTRCRQPCEKDPMRPFRRDGTGEPETLNPCSTRGLSWCGESRAQRVYLCLLHELVKTEQPHEWKPVAAETSQTDF